MAPLHLASSPSVAELAECLAALSAPDEATAVANVLETAARLVEADVAAVVVAGDVVAQRSRGAWSGQPTLAELAEMVEAAAAPGATTETTETIGTAPAATPAADPAATAATATAATATDPTGPTGARADGGAHAGAAGGTREAPARVLGHVITAPLEVAGRRGTMVLARSGGTPFPRECAAIASATATAATPILRSLHVLATLRERQQLLEQLNRVQRSVSLRDPVDAVLDSLTASAATLLGDRMVALHLVEDESLVIRSFAGGAVRDRGLAEAIWREVRACRRAVSADNLILEEIVDGLPAGGEAYAGGSVLVATVRDRRDAIGTLSVLSPGRIWGPAEREVLISFAAHAGMALADARAVADLEGAVGDALQKALHDPLTGLANRARFIDRLEHGLTRRPSPGDEVGVLYIDLDDFKMVNDRWGHAVGDRVLVEVADRLRRSVRAADTCARTGGDEFAVLLEHSGGVVQAAVVANRLMDTLRRPIDVDGTELTMATSIGIAIAEGTGTSPGDMLRNADVALYRAKSAGKNRVVLFESTMYESLLERAELEHDLRAAVEAGHIDVHFQPIVDLATEAIVGVEALARWTDPRRGTVPPLTFIPVAEETGLIVSLGELVLEKACHWVGSWHQAHPGDVPLHLSVNVSARQLMASDLAARVQAAMARSGMAPGSLVLEITESVLLADNQVTASRLRELRDLGVRLAIDDFGTGYSSLSYLCRFPVDLLKIDRSFVAALSGGEDVRRLTEAIVTLGDALGIASVAEGVEDAAELAALRTMGCRQAQGYLFARPMPAADLEAVLAGAAAGAAWEPTSE